MFYEPTVYFLVVGRQHTQVTVKALTWNGSCSYVLCIHCRASCSSWSTCMLAHTHTYKCQHHSTLMLCCVSQQGRWTRSCFCASDRHTQTHTLTPPRRSTSLCHDLTSFCDCDTLLIFSLWALTWAMDWNVHDSITHTHLNSRVRGLGVSTGLKPPIHMTYTNTHF